MNTHNNIFDELKLFLNILKSCNTFRCVPVVKTSTALFRKPSYRLPIPPISSLESFQKHSFAKRLPSKDFSNRR